MKRLIILGAIVVLIGTSVSGDAQTTGNPYVLAVCGTGVTYRASTSTNFNYAPATIDVTGKECIG